MKKKITKKDIIYLSIIGVLLILLGFLLVKAIMNKSNSFEAYYNRKCLAYSVENANYAKGQIIFIGDSITDLYTLDEYYKLPLATYNRGIGGDTTEGVLKRLDVSLFDLKPKAVVLMIGTNDVNGRKDEDGIIDRYEKILKSIKDHLPDTLVYVMSIIPQNSDIGTYSSIDYKDSNEIITRLNEQINSLVTKYSYTYLDLFSLLLNDDGLNKNYSDDGLHLNKEGFIIWTNLLKPYLEVIE